MINGFLTLRGRRELNDDNAFYSLKKKPNNVTTHSTVSIKHSTFITTLKLCCKKSSLIYAYEFNNHNLSITDIRRIIWSHKALAIRLIQKLVRIYFYVKTAVFLSFFTPRPGLVNYAVFVNYQDI